MKRCLIRHAWLVPSILVGGLPQATAAAQSLSSRCRPPHCATVNRPIVNHVVPGYPACHVRPFRGVRQFAVAEVIRASGQANLLNAVARTQRARAARLETENSVRALQAHLERKRINREARFGHLHARAPHADEERRAGRWVATADEDRPVDPHSGRVAWPLLLRTRHFDQARAPIDQVFAQRAREGSFHPDHYLPMRDWIERIEQELKANLDDYELNDYVESRDFLRKLLDEARRDFGPVAGDTSWASTRR